MVPCPWRWHAALQYLHSHSTLVQKQLLPAFFTLKEKLGALSSTPKRRRTMQDIAALYVGKSDSIVYEQLYMECRWQMGTGGLSHRSGHPPFAPL